jgi:hypothetical protein
MNPIEQEGLFATVHAGGLPLIWDEEAKDVNGPEVLKMIGLSYRDAARAARIPEKSVKSGQPLPDELMVRAREWAAIVGLVAGFFHGDVLKTALWFKMRNPLLGGLSPREMIEFDRAAKLRDIVENALAGNLT